MTLGSNTTHQDNGTVEAIPANPTTNAPVPGAEVSDEDRFNADTKGTPDIEVEKETVDEIDADTLEEGVYVPAGESVELSIPVTNTGDIALRDVVVGDTTVTGPAATSFACTFPDGTSGSTQADGSIRWDASFGDPPAQTWAVGVTFTCTATLTMPGDAELHEDVVEVTAVDLDAQGVTATDPFHAFSASIDIVKYDARQDPPADPVDGHDDADGVYDGPTTGDWDPKVDADTTEDAVEYELVLGSSGPHEVGFLVTNTGAAPIIDVSVSDLTLTGPAVTGLSCDFSPLGGPTTGVEWAGPLDPGATFTCSGSLTLAPGETHQDSGSAEGTPVNPKTTVPEAPIDDEDRFTGTTPPKPTGGIDVEKFDEGFGTPETYVADEVNAALALDADAPANAVEFTAGEARRVIIAITNDGDEDLIDLEVSDATTSGTGQLEGLSCDFSALGGPATGTSWEGPLSPGEHVYCSGTLTLGAAADHTDKATVTATGAESGDTYGDEDDYNATTGEVTNDRTPPPAPGQPPAPDSGTGSKGILPRTGAAITTMTALGLGLFALGLVLTRRRRSSSAA